jgi:DUF4097 and DUF4098 domain-containing protein YvlB
MMAFICGFAARAVFAEQEEIRRSFDLNPGATVSIENVSGNITISSWERSEVEMVAIKSGPSDQLKAVEVSINATPSRLKIKVNYPRKSNNNVSVSFNLKVPQNVELDSIRSVSGSIEIMDIGGRTIASSVSGNVEARNVDGETNLESISGKASAMRIRDRVSVSSVSGGVTASDVDGDAAAKSVSGSVVLGRVQGRIEAESVSGKIAISESNPSDLKASTVSGKIQFDGRLRDDGRYDLKSHSGSVTMNLPADSSFNFQASTFSGSIKSDFSITMNGLKDKKKISGVVGEGGPSVEMSSFSGSIRVSKSGN